MRMRSIAYSTFLSIMNAQRCGTFGQRSLNLSRNQNDRKISVIIGNPPYNAWQENFNQNNANRVYGQIDKQIKATYIKQRSPLISITKRSLPAQPTTSKEIRSSMLNLSNGK
jgi:predicted helicase